jgi:hypothetical protein
MSAFGKCERQQWVASSRSGPRNDLAPVPGFSRVGEAMAVDRPTKFERVIDMKATKALGITIPQSILLRADKVIE